MPVRQPFLIPNLSKLKRDVKSARGLERINIERLYNCLKPDSNRSPRDVYDLHWALIYLLTGDGEAKIKAKDAVWIEAMQGGPSSRPGHHWAHSNFLEMHFWISSAMAAHIAIAMDWLAGAGVFSGKEIKAMGDHFVSKFWEHIYPHLKGRGRAPIYVEPMNQDSAMVVGCLVIGYLFGHKWGKDYRAQRIFADAKVMAGNLLGQFFPTGFDNDGFTYMRVIQPPILSLLCMVMEEVEGIDFYHCKFIPNHFSVAMFMEKLQKFHLPSGMSFPHGRYGYVKEWSMYSQAFAARKTGESHYLERVLSLSQDSFIHPWIAMDLPLAVAWAPYGKEPGAPKKKWSPVYETWHDPAIWSNIGSPVAKVQAQLSWRIGQQSTFIAEHDGERCVLLAGESPETRNGFYFPNLQTRPAAGNDFECAHLPGLQMSCIQLKDQLNPAIIREYRKYLLVFDSGVLLSLDNFMATKPLEASYRLCTIHPIENGTMRSEHGKKRVQVLSNLLLEPIADGELMREGKKRPGIRHKGGLKPARAGYGAALVNFGRIKVEDFAYNSNSVSWRRERMRFSVHLNLDPSALLQSEDGDETDSRLLLNWGTDLILWGARRWKRKTNLLWSTGRLNFSHIGPTLSVESLEYGQFLRYRNALLDLSLLRGNGYDIYVRSQKKTVLVLPRLQEGGFVQVNGKSARIKHERERTLVTIEPTEKLAETTSAVLEGLLDLKAPKADLMMGLHQVLTSHRLAYLPLVRRLLDHEDTYIRLAASEVIGWLGDEEDGALLIEKLLRESGLTSSVGGIGPPWHGKWAFFSTITVMADSLRKLGNQSVVPDLNKALAIQVEPHAIDSIKTAIQALSPMGAVAITAEKSTEYEQFRKK